MRANFGRCLDHIFDEMCQMNTKIVCIARQQSRLGGFASSSSPQPTEDSLNGGDNDDDASGSKYDDEMTTSQ